MPSSPTPIGHQPDPAAVPEEIAQIGLDLNSNVSPDAKISRDKFPPFRILVLGKRNAGKTTILGKLCGGREIICDQDGHQVSDSPLIHLNCLDQHKIVTLQIPETLIGSQEVCYGMMSFELVCTKLNQLYILAWSTYHWEWDSVHWQYEIHLSWFKGDWSWLRGWAHHCDWLCQEEGRCRTVVWSITCHLVRIFANILSYSLSDVRVCRVCIPTDDDRFLSEMEKNFFQLHTTGKQRYCTTTVTYHCTCVSAPIVAVFTKLDGRDAKLYSKIEEEEGSDDAIDDNEVIRLVNDHLIQNDLPQIKGLPLPPCVCLRGQPCINYSSSGPTFLYSYG